MCELRRGKLVMDRNQYHSIALSRRVIHSLNENYGHFYLSNDQALVTKSKKILLFQHFCLGRQLIWPTTFLRAPSWVPVSVKFLEWGLESEKRQSPSSSNNCQLITDRPSPCDHHIPCHSQIYFDIGDLWMTALLTSPGRTPNHQMIQRTMRDTTNFVWTQVTQVTQVFQHTPPVFLNSSTKCNLLSNFSANWLSQHYFC